MESYSITEVTGATFYPVTLEEAKAHLRVEISDDDALITRQIQAATGWAENYTGRVFAQRTFRLDLPRFCPAISLPKWPVQEVVSIVYDDADGVEQTVAAADYELDAYNATIRPAYGEYWPSARSHWNAVRITFGAGYYSVSPVTSPQSSAIPEDVKAGILIALGDLYENRERQQDMALYTNKTAEMLLHMYRIYL